MDTLIIFAHPWEGSFNNAILEHIETRLKEQEKSYQVIDLYKDGFNPSLEEKDLSTFAEGIYQDPLAEKYSKALLSAEEVIFIYPIWWYGPPAILKGFFDKVFLKNHLYRQENKGPMEGLLETKRTIMITTANMGRDNLEAMGDPITNLYLNGIMGFMGSQEQKWLHCEQVHEKDRREKLLEEIDKLL